MAAFDWRVLRMGWRDEGVLPDLPVLDDELEVVAVAQDVELLEGITLGYQQIRVGTGLDDAETDAFLRLFFLGEIRVGVFVRIHAAAPAEHVAGRRGGGFENLIKGERYPELTDQTILS